MSRYHMRDMRKHHKSTGQSMVEFAVVLPILLFILAGVLEIGNMLSAFVQIEAAAREGARLGAQGLNDKDIGSVLDQEIDNLRRDPNDLQVWVVRPVISDDTGTIEWFCSTGDTPWGRTRPPGADEDGYNCAEQAEIKAQCVYGLTTTCGGEIDDEAVSAQIPVEPASITDTVQDLSDRANISGLGTLGGERIVVVALYYEVIPILNLPVYPLPLTSEGYLPISTFAVMKQEVSQSSIDILVGGCSAYPIAISSELVYDDAGRPRNGDTVCSNCAHGSDFMYLAWSDYWISAGEPHPGGKSGGELFLEGLEPPGNSKHLDDGYVALPRPAGDTPADTAIHIGDTVITYNQSPPPPAAVSFPPVTSQVRDQMENHYETSRMIRVVVFNEEVDVFLDGGGTVWKGLRVADFAIVRIVADNSDNLGYLSAQLIRIESNCGLNADSGE